MGGAGIGGCCCCWNSKGGLGCGCSKNRGGERTAKGGDKTQARTVVVEGDSREPSLCDLVFMWSVGL